MCGIVYSQSFTGQPVNNDILQQYDKQKSRGQQGFGIFDGIHGHLVHAAEENRILNWLCKPKNESSLLLMHHRFPTSTVNVRQAAHPFSTKEYFGDTQYVLVHNGTIRNDDELFVAHQELGINYHSLLSDLTFNDSEALLWDFALYMEGKQEKVTAAGAIAFICLKLVKGKLEKMYFARNTSPLNLERTKDGINLSSEGAGQSITPDTLYTWNYDLKRLTQRPMRLASYVYTPNTGYKAQEYYPPYQNRWNSWDDEDEYDYPDGNYGNYQVPEWAGSIVQRKWNDHLSQVKINRDTETNRLAKQYLTACGGHYESAYCAAEYDYEQLWEDAELCMEDNYTYNPDLNDQIMQLERVMELLYKEGEEGEENSCLLLSV